MFTAITSLVTGVLIARMLGPSGRGLVVVFATWGQALAWAGGLSIDKALMARDSTDGRRQTEMPMAAGLSMLLMVGAVVALLSTVGSAQIFEEPWLSAALGAVVLGTVAYDARAAQLLCQGRWRQYAALRFAQPATYLVGCLGVGATVAWAPGLSVAPVVAALCVSLWAPAIFVGGLPRLRISWPRKRDARRLLTFAGAYHVGSVLSFLTSRIDLLAVSVLFGTKEVGLYSVAASLGQIAAIFGSVNLIRGITGRLTSAGIDRGGLAAVGMMTAVLVIFAPWLIELAYGAEFSEAGELAMFLCFGGLLFYLRHGLNGQLTGRGRPWMTAWANGVGVAGFMLLLTVADTLAGIAAASVAATAVSTAVSFGLLRWCGRRGAEADAPEMAPETLKPTFLAK